jgi:two-component system, cell cycle response regulator DivK
VPTEIRRDMLLDWPVLIVDDDPSSLEVASMMLSFYGAKVSTAINGEEGLKLAQASRPRFILTDLSMPVMDGWTLLGHLKKDPRLAEIPVIALTAHAMNGDRARAMAAGCHNYLTKPLLPSTFINELITLLVDIPSFNLDLEPKQAQPESTPVPTEIASAACSPESVVSAPTEVTPEPITAPMTNDEATPMSAEISPKERPSNA